MDFNKFMLILVSSISFFFFHHTFPMSYAELLLKTNGKGSNKTSHVRSYIIHVQKPKGAEFLTNEDIPEWHRSFLPNTTLDSGEPRLIYSYYETISGFAARLTPEEVKAMEPMEGFVRAEPESKLQRGTTYTHEFLRLRESDGVWPMNYFGSGIVIGVVDSGILPSHPSFNDTGMPAPDRKWQGRCGFLPPHRCNNKIIAARSYVHGNYPSPLDDTGHGTHVAGIAGGNFVENAHVLGNAKGRAAGTAPKAHLAVYKVSLTSIDVAKGIDTAVGDGVDIISVSIYQPSTQLNTSSIMVAAFAAVKKGIFFCACAGNKGPFRSSLANDAPWIMTVGASTTDRRITATLMLGDQSIIEGESVLSTTNASTTMSGPLTFPGFRGRPGTRGCTRNSFANITVTGMIVMCGTNSANLLEMGENVKRAGGAAMIILNNWGETTWALIHALPTIHLTESDSYRIVDYFDTTPDANVTVFFNGTQLRAISAPAVTIFSGRGPSLVNGGILKPDVIAPGSSILSASHKISKKLEFVFESGTSQATPHVSGIAALIKKAHLNWSPAAIRSAIMTTAYITNLNRTAIIDHKDGKPADYFAIGAGHVRPTEAVDPGLIYDITATDYLKYLCGMGFNDNQVSQFNGNTSVHCSNIGSISPEQLNYPSISLNMDPAGGDKVINREVTNVGVANSSYSFQWVDPSGVSMTVTPTILQFSSLNEKQSYSVKFSIKGTPPASGTFSEGELSWVYNKYTVRSPVSVSFS